MQISEHEIIQFEQFLREEEKSEITIKKYVCTRRKRITVKSAESGSAHLRLTNPFGIGFDTIINIILLSNRT